MRWIVLLFVAAMLAGCATDPETEPEPEVVDDTPVETMVNETVAPPELHVAVLVLDNATEAVNGTFQVPADTNITFDAQGTTNATGFTWVIGNQTYTDAVVTHAFAPGLHAVNVTALGDNVTSALSLAINATALDTEPELIGQTDIGFSTGTGNVVNSGCVEGSQDLSFPGVTRHVRMKMALSFTTSLSVTYRLGLEDADGNVVLEESRDNGNADMVLDQETELAAGDYKAYVSVCGTLSPQTTLDVTGKADHYDG